MTPDKYTDSKLEQILKGVDSKVRDIKEALTGVYRTLGELAETADDIHRAVTCTTTTPNHVPDDDWDFLDEED